MPYRRPRQEMDTKHIVDATNVVQDGEQVRRRFTDIEVLESSVAADVIKAIDWLSIV